MIRMTHLLALVVIATSLVITSPSADAVRPHGHDKTEEERNQALASKIWWNQKRKINQLGLSEEQREQMDEHLMAYLEGFNTHARAEKQLFRQLGDALTGGDQTLAETTRNELSQSTADTVNRQINMMIEVMSLLSEEQKTQLADQYPLLSSRLWITAANPAAMQLGRREPGNRHAH